MEDRDKLLHKNTDKNLSILSPILRARELERWAASPAYAQLLARGKPYSIPVVQSAPVAR